MKNIKNMMLIALGCMLMSCGSATASSSIDPRNCQHKAHDQETEKCLACGKYVEHNYVDGKCTHCDKTTKYRWDSIAQDKELIQLFDNGGVEHKGTVEEVTYSTRAYNLEALGEEEQTIEKKMYVYLPYGYTTEKQYDVLVLLHGSQNIAGHWFCQGDYCNSHMGLYSTMKRCYTQDLLDYMIDKGQAKECIVVTPTYYDNVRDNDDSENWNRENKVLLNEFHKELTGAILPTITSKYSTYAKSSSENDLVASRDHFAYAGFSYGGMLGTSSIMPDCLKYFSYFGTFSGTVLDVDTFVDKVGKSIAQYPVKQWTFCIGQDDGTVKFNDAKKAYKRSVGLVDGLTEGTNCSGIYVRNENHTYSCSLTALSNSLLDFFKK